MRMNSIPYNRRSSTTTHFSADIAPPGCSAVGLKRECHAKTRDDIRELMSGNICRCGAYLNIVAAIEEVIGKSKKRGVAP